MEMALELEQQTQEILRTLEAQAAARNMEFSEYLRLFAQAGDVAAPGAEPTLAEFESLLEQVSAGLPLMPALPLDFSRADIYAGHD